MGHPEMTAQAYRGTASSVPHVLNTEHRHSHQTRVLKPAPAVAHRSVAPSWRPRVGDLRDAPTPIRPHPLRQFPRGFTLQRNTYPVAHGIGPESAVPGC